MRGRRRFDRITRVVSVGILGAIAPACRSGANPSRDCDIDCFGPPPGCLLVDPITEGDCAAVTCGKLVCAAVDADGGEAGPGSGTRVALGDGAVLAGDPIHIAVFDGDPPTAQVSVVASAGAIHWTLSAAFSAGAVAARTLLADVGAVRPAPPGLANVDRKDTQASSSAIFGNIRLVGDDTGSWAGTVETDQDSLSAALRGSAVLTCFVPAGALDDGGEDGGEEQPDGEGAEPPSPANAPGSGMVQDPGLRTGFCSQFR